MLYYRSLFMNQSKLKIIVVSGPDAEKFLQGQLTCDVRQVTAEPSLAAHCNAKGRVMSLFRIQRKDDTFQLLVPEDMVESTYTQLKKYAVFSKVKLDILNDEIVDPAWHLRDIKAGIPRLYPQTIGEFLPHDINLVKLGAVSFAKGCYTGQEIIARMQNRGKLKKYLALVEFDSKITLIPGQKLTNQEQVVDVITENQQQLVLLIR